MRLGVEDDDCVRQDVAEGLQERNIVRLVLLPVGMIFMHGTSEQLRVIHEDHSAHATIFHDASVYSNMCQSKTGTSKVDIEQNTGTGMSCGAPAGCSVLPERIGTLGVRSLVC